MRALQTIALLLVLSACATGAGSGAQDCTEIGTPVGIGLDIEPPLATKVAKATVEACWDGSCRTSAVELLPSTAPGPTTCVGDVCSAEVRPTQGKNGFADMAGLPRKSVNVTVTLADEAGATLVRRSLEVTPQMQFPNGPDCPGGGPQAQVVVSGEGTVSPRGW
ncbi:MAG: hypothetical protein ACRDQW_08520 [Haloechinothrix sp.]